MPNRSSPDLPEAPPRQTPGRAIAFALAVGSLAIVAFVLAGIVRLADSAVVPVTSSTALVLLAMTPLVRRLARWAGASRPEVCASLSLLGVAPVLFCGALAALSNEPLLAAHWRCGTGEMMLAALAPIPFGLLGTLGALMSLLLRARGGVVFDRVIHALVRGGLALGLLLVAAATLRAARHPSTDNASRYFDALPTVAVLPPLTVSATTETPAPSAPAELRETTLQDIVVQQRCERDDCSVALHPAGVQATPGETWPGALSVPAGAPVRVQLDAPHGLWILGGIAAFRVGRLAPTSVYVNDIHDALSAPPGWILGAAAALAITVALGARRRRLARRLAQIEAASDGVLGENGWITFEDGTASRRASPDLDLAPGRVLLLHAQGVAGHATAYRSEGGRDGGEILIGDRARHGAALRERLAGLDALGLAALLLAGAPLVAALTQGLIVSLR